MALHLDLNLLGQTFIVLTQDNQDFIATEVIRNLSTFGQCLTQLGTGKHNAALFIRRTGAQGRHAVTFGAVESPVDFQRRALQRFAGLVGWRNFIKNGLGLEHAVEITDTGMGIKFQRIVDGEVVRRVTGTTVRVE